MRKIGYRWTSFQKFVCWFVLFSFSVSGNPVYAARGKAEGRIHRVFTKVRAGAITVVSQFTGGRSSPNVRPALVSKVGNIASRQKGIFSNKDISNIAEMDLQQVNEILYVLEQAGRIKLLGTGMNDTTLWVFSSVVEAQKINHGMNEGEAKNQLLKEYLNQEHAVLIAEQIRFTISMQTGAISRKDISDISGIDLRQVANTLNVLSEQGEISPLRIEEGNIELLVSLELLRERMRGGGISENEAKKQFLGEYLNPIKEQAVAVSEFPQTEAESPPVVDKQSAVVLEQQQTESESPPVVDKQDVSVSEQQQTEAESLPVVDKQDVSVSEQKQTEVESQPVVDKQDVSVSEQKQTEAESPPVVDKQGASVSEQQQTEVESQAVVDKQGAFVPEQQQTEAELQPVIREQVASFIQDLVDRNPQSLADVDVMSTSIKQQFPSVSDHTLNAVLHWAKRKQVKELVSNLQKDFITVAYISNYFPNFPESLIEEALKDLTHESAPVLFLMADVLDFSQIPDEFRDRRIRWALQTTYIRVDFLKKENINQNPDFETLMFFYRIQAEQEIQAVIKAFAQKQEESTLLFGGLPYLIWMCISKNIFMPYM